MRLLGIKEFVNEYCAPERGTVFKLSYSTLIVVVAVQVVLSVTVPSLVVVVEVVQLTVPVAVPVMPPLTQSVSFLLIRRILHISKLKVSVRYRSRQNLFFR